MKVEIKKVLTLKGDNFFRLYADGEIVKSFYFELNAVVESPLNEEAAYSEALTLAKKIETGLIETEETVYTTSQK